MAKNSVEIAAENDLLINKLRQSKKVDVVDYGVSIGLKMSKNVSKVDALNLIKNHYSFINLSLRMSERISNQKKLFN